MQAIFVSFSYKAYGLETWLAVVVVDIFLLVRGNKVNSHNLLLHINK